MTYISRNPFARTETHRELVETKNGCSYCGSTRKSGKLFQYRTEHDGGRKETHRGLFCSIACHDSYHG